MKKIVELIVKMDELEMEDVGVDAVALVEFPAIELPFMAFAQEEAFVEPNAGESEEDFISRCVPTLINEGYDQDQAVAVCYSYYESKLSSDESDLLQSTVLELAEEFGESYDPQNVHFVDMSKESFSTVGDFLKGIGALDLLSKNDLKKRKSGRTMYRYSGPIAQRNFCKALQRMNKLYTQDEIFEMERRAINQAFGPRGNSGYSIWTWKGGPNCKHFWEELTVFPGDNGQLIFLSHGPVSGRAGESTYNLPNHGYINRRNFSFSVIDEEQRVVVGPVLVPQKLIRRVDKATREEYFVYFSEQTIKDVAEMMFKRNLQNRTNVEHDSFDTDTNNTLLESWIVTDPVHDKAKALGFDVPKGTLMQARRINDDKTWEMVKEGKLKGFSVEGMFLEKATVKKQNEDDQLMSTILNILKQIK